VPLAEPESREDKGSERNRIDWGQNSSRCDESTLLENHCKISIEKLALQKKDQNKFDILIGNFACLPQAGNLQ
jgi:hypothetical protein